MASNIAAGRSQQQGQQGLQPVVLQAMVVVGRHECWTGLVTVVELVSLAAGQTLHVYLSQGQQFLRAPDTTSQRHT
jgi:hypothetical protein